MFVQKHLFHTPRLKLEVGAAIAATVGYETYGTLNDARDNAILICHGFTGTSHAAGRYHSDDEVSGWWDPLIGPGKAFDTNRYYVIAADSLCNLNITDPLVITTGPSTIDPATGRPQGIAFPPVVMRDQVRLQQQLVQSLGIERLACVAGPSTGGFQALEWAVTYPDQVQKVVAVATNYQAPAIYALAVCQAAIDAIVADPAYAGGGYYGGSAPVSGVARATHLLTTFSRSNQWLDGKWERRTAPGSVHPWADKEGRYAFQTGMEEIAVRVSRNFDANHFIYAARAALCHDIGHGNGGLEGALQKIQAELLLLPITSDLLFPPELSQNFWELLRESGVSAALAPIHSASGHLAGLDEAARLAEPITHFLGRDALH